MSIGQKIQDRLPSARSAGLSLLGALLLAGAFPDLDQWYVAWVAFVPFLLAVYLERNSLLRSFLVSWLFGTAFFFVSCWWLTFAPITYAGFPVIPTYLLLLCATGAAGVFPAIAGGVTARLMNRYGMRAVLVAPFVWTALEFARLWITGNNWNAVGYSQAFVPSAIANASIGGVHLTGFTVVMFNAMAVCLAYSLVNERSDPSRAKRGIALAAAGWLVVLASVSVPLLTAAAEDESPTTATVVAVQPNVPMKGLNSAKWRSLRERQTQLASDAIRDLKTKDGEDVVVVLPESPMNYQYDLDPEFRGFINGYARDNRVSVLFNSAEPDASRERGFFNSAVLVGENGEKADQYDKIHLLPFGEFVPLPEFAQELIPPMVGRFSHGSEYDLLPVGEAKAGVMICFESHFGSLSAEYARRGADLLIEMTNDGYLGPTPVLRQHLANAVFRAVESGRPVLRVTNVGVTAHIAPNGLISNEAGTYTEAVRVWNVSKSKGGLTLYARFGDWFAVFCCVICAGFLVSSYRRRPRSGE